MGKQPTGSGGEPSSPNCETSAEVRLVNFASDSACLTRGLAPKRTTPQHQSILMRLRRTARHLGQFCACMVLDAAENAQPIRHCGTARGPTAPAHARPLLHKKRELIAQGISPFARQKQCKFRIHERQQLSFLFTPPGSAGYRAPPARPLRNRQSAGSRRWVPPSRSFRRHRTPQAAPGTSGPRTKPPRPRRRPC